MGTDRAKDIWRNTSNFSPHQKKMMVPYILEKKLKKIPGPKISPHLKKKINKNSNAEFPSSLDSNNSRDTQFKNIVCFTWCRMTTSDCFE